MSRIVIVGKGGSGKDYLKKKFIEKGLTQSISFTTRPPRVNEKEGIDYFFVSEPKFTDMADRGSFLEADNFNGWYYGTPLAEFESKQIFIMTPRGVSRIPVEFRKTTMVVYLDIDFRIRQDRLAQRGDSDSVARRINADEKDFEGFADFDLRITNADF